MRDILSPLFRVRLPKSLDTYGDGVFIQRRERHPDHNGQDFKILEANQTPVSVKGELSYCVHYDRSTERLIDLSQISLFGDDVLPNGKIVDVVTISDLSKNLAVSVHTPRRDYYILVYFDGKDYYLIGFAYEEQVQTDSNIRRIGDNYGREFHVVRKRDLQPMHLFSGVLLGSAFNAPKATINE